MNKYSLLNRAVLAQCYLWIDNHTNERDGELPDICYKIRTAGYNSLHINRFSQEEADMLKELTSKDEFKHIREVDISLIVMALEVMKKWIEDVPKKDRPFININDKKLLFGQNSYFKYMIAVKQKNPEIYQNQKDIMTTTSVNAQLWYSYIKKNTVK